jgi:NAD(P)-dependent dehydrogenase (short-subunit alcohol dehydrogenase family)
MPTSSCVVTGGAGGIGRAIAEQMVARGHRVVVTDLDGEGAARTAAEIGAAEGFAQDVRDPASHRTVAEAAGRHGPLTAWFNNAGVAFDQDLVDLTDEQVRATVEVNLLGVIWGTRAAVDAFGDAGGDVVITSSLSALGPVPNLSAYAATKAAVLSLAMSVNLETPRKVRVHALCPDGVATPMVEAMVGGKAEKLVRSGGRMLTAEEVAAAAAGLVGSRRVVHTLPGWRGAVMRFGALMPSQAGPAMKVLELQGTRRVRRKRHPS